MLSGWVVLKLALIGTKLCSECYTLPEDSIVRMIEITLRECGFVVLKSADYPLAFCT